MFKFVGMIAFEGKILILREDGKLFQVEYDRIDGRPSVKEVHQFPIGPFD